MSARIAFAAVAVLAAFACAPVPRAPGAAPGAGRVRDSPAAYAHPEPDPGCRATVQERLTAHSLDRVTVKVAADAQGKLVLLEFLAPDLSPAAMMELRQTFEKCAWKPVVKGDGNPEARTTSFIRTR